MSLVFAERGILNKTPKGHVSPIRKQIQSPPKKKEEKKRKINIKLALVVATRDQYSGE